MANSSENQEAEDQEQVQDLLLQQWDDLFKDRYTEQDADYKRHVDSAMPDPPCVENWYVRPKRTFDWARGRGGRGGNRGNHRDRDGPSRVLYAGKRDDDSYHPYSRDQRGRGGGGGGGYRGGYNNRDNNRGGYRGGRDRDRSGYQGDRDRGNYHGDRDRGNYGDRDRGDYQGRGRGGYHQDNRGGHDNRRGGGGHHGNRGGQRHEQW